MEPFMVENPQELKEKTSSKVPIIIYIILGLVIIGLAIGLIVIILKREEKEKIIYKEKEIPVYYPVVIPNINENFFGKVKRNQSYDTNGIINNTFGVNGTHYIEEVGDIHNSLDYKKTESNVYDLFIPSSAFLNKNGTNGIFLFIHGGAWGGGMKEEMDKFLVSYGQMGYITANMEYTLLSNSKDTNIFRIVDEITACIENIKEQLKNEGFNETKLELAIFGYSAGAHLSLLYSYLIDDSPIKIKFVVNICGPISLERKYCLRLKKVNDTLANLELPEIEKALKENRLNLTQINYPNALFYMNLFLGSKYEYNEISEMMYFNGSDIEINYENEKYQDLLKRTNYAFPLYIEDKNKVPVLCYYTGNDEVVGVVSYAYLQQKAIEDNKTIELIYSKYSFHNHYNFDLEDSVESLRKLNLRIIDYAKDYFSKE